MGIIKDRITDAFDKYKEDGDLTAFAHTMLDVGDYSIRYQHQKNLADSIIDDMKIKEPVKIMQVNDKVKVVRCIDDSVPVEKRFIGMIGVIAEINSGRPAPITVYFSNANFDGFWPEELETIE